PISLGLRPQLNVSGRVKTYVLDTNVLLHDPRSIFRFEENNLVIPVEVLEELDAIKGEQSTERGRNARRVHRILQELFPDSRSMQNGVKLSNGGTLSVVINRYLRSEERRVGKECRSGWSACQCTTKSIAS